ncbi:MAG: TRAP transporter small permease, partial [Methylobacterium sp.]|nr:TRAP transporter small permease [Methylobacterium sp.]
IFWMMCGAVFLQFFTRYVLNNSFAWTEEIAIYCLVAVVFLGSVGCVRQTRHIHVDFLYRMISPPAGRVMATLVDIARIVVFAYLALLVWRYSALIHDERMTTIDFPKSPVFLLVFASFVLMALRGVQVLIANIRRGYSVLERPGAFDGSQEG